MRDHTGCIDRIFDKYLSNFVLKYKLVVISVALVWLAFSAWRAVIIEAVPYTEQFFSSNYPIQKILDLQQSVLYND